MTKMRHTHTQKVLEVLQNSWVIRCLAFQDCGWALRVTLCDRALVRGEKVLSKGEALPGFQVVGNIRGTAAGQALPPTSAKQMRLEQPWGEDPDVTSP